MRLIDGDALEELFREVISGIAKRPDMNGNMEHMIRASAMVIEMIKDAPTIEPQRTGKWIDYSEDGYVECPFCHSATNCDDNIDELHFCFSCGAKMEEPEDISMEYFESGGR